MPDESTAATEHALLAEVAAPLHNLPDDPVPIAADVEFPIVLRGYDRLAVDAYVKKTSQLVAELQATRSPDAAVRRALERVGEEVAGVLQRAHETAAQLTAQSRSEAEERLQLARQEAADIVAQAQQHLRDLDAETDRIWAERRRIVEDARELASQLTSLAGEAAERFPGEEVEESASASEVEQTQVLPADGLASDSLDRPEPPAPVQAPPTPAQTPTLRVSRGPNPSDGFG